MYRWRVIFTTLDRRRAEIFLLLISILSPAGVRMCNECEVK
jgi:hypothetical protein